MNSYNRKGLLRVNPAWMVILAGVAAALHVGKLSPALPVLHESLGVTLVQAGFLLSLVQLAGMALGLAVGLLVDGLGLKRSMISGLLVLAVASIFGGLAQEPAALLFWRGVEGLGFLLVAMPAPSLIRQLVPSNRLSGALGVWGAYMPLGTALALLCGPLLILQASWQMWWWTLALLSVLVAGCLWVVVPPDWVRRASTHALTPGNDAKTHAVAHAWSARLRLTLTSSGPWLVALSFAVYSGQWLAVIGFLPSIYAQAGVGSGATAVLTALVAAVNMIGNIASGRLLGRGVRPENLLYIGFAVMGLSTAAAFATWPFQAAGEGLPTSARYVAVLLFSMVGGMIPGTLFSQAVRLAPTDGTVSTTVGWMQQWAAFGQFAGPPLVAWVAQRVGGWHWTWGVTGLCSVLGVALARAIGNRNRR
jgi:MFS family permease